VHDAFPDKRLLYTESALGPFDWARMDEWQWGEQYGREIIHDLNNWTVGWVDWNLLLDETGGPNHVGNYCYAPIIGDTRGGGTHYMNVYYYMGHLSRFIRPGARRIVCSSNEDRLLATAFQNTDGKIAVVAMNESEQDVSFQVWIEKRAAPTSAPAHSIVTVVI